MKGFKDVIILVLISTIAGLCLSLVYSGTKEQIEAAKLATEQAAVQNVAPFMTEVPAAEKFEFKNDIIPIYPARKDGNLQGAVLKITTPEGFGGNVVFLMGVDAGGAVTGFQILESKETPGLGSKAADKAFWGQFLGKKLGNFTFKVKKDKGDVDAITASTITSRAVTNAMDKGLEAYKAYRGGA